LFFGFVDICSAEFNILEDVDISGGATFIFQNAHNANGDILSEEGTDVDDTSFTLDLKIEKKFQDFCKLFIHLETRGGEGVGDELKVFSNVNNDAYSRHDVRLREGWCEHYLSDLSLTLNIGKLDPTRFIDSNEYANDECHQFLGGIFVNSPSIEFGDNAAGIRLGLEPVEFMDLELVVMDTKSDWEDVFDEMFIAAQLNIKPEFFQRPGNYRLLGWFNGGDHTKWLDTTQTEESGYGFGLNFDQELNDNLGAFFRYGWQDPKVYSIGSDFSLEYSWSAGLQLDGGIWNRHDDTLGFAYGLIFPSDEYKDSQNRSAKSEGHLELYYRYKVNDYFSLSPDLQVVWRPYGRDATNGSDAIVAFGLRGQIDF